MTIAIDFFPEMTSGSSDDGAVAWFDGEMKDRRAEPISVLMVVDVSLYRFGLERALSQVEGLAVIGSFARAEDALQEIRESWPDIVLLDPRSDPQGALMDLLDRECPRSRVIALGIREVEHDVLRCAEAGYAAYVPRDASIGELIEVVKGAARGEVRCSPQIAASLFRRLAVLADGSPAPPSQQLTPREREIAGLIGEGLSNKQIARRLQIGLSTVKNHVHNLLTKLNASHRGVAAALVNHPEGFGLSRGGAQWLG